MSVVPPATSLPDTAGGLFSQDAQGLLQRWQGGVHSEDFIGDLGLSSSCPSAQPWGDPSKCWVQGWSPQDKGDWDRLE